jgi:hypothetical protein
MTVFANTPYTLGQGLSVFLMSLRAQRGNLVAAAMVICRRVFNLNEIATWFDRLTMSGCAPRNDRGWAPYAMTEAGLV